jgi:cell division protein FtsI/penicillin-binding protein 2
LNTGSSADNRRHRLLTRAIPLLVVAAVAFIVGAVAANGPEAPTAQSFLDAWEQGDYAAMHAQLSPQSQSDHPLNEFERTYVDATATITQEELTIGEMRIEGDAAVAPVTIESHAFGELGGDISLPLVDDQIDWSPHLVFPGLADNERLTRRTRAPQRAPILAADRTTLAKGAASARSLDSAATAVVGEVSTPSRAQANELARRGFPPGSLAGTSGLELAWDERLAGQPGGQLLAVSAEEESEVGGGRILASSEPVPGEAVRTTIDPDLQAATVSALGDLYGGVAVLDARKGSILALAGLGYSAPQPPGSTFKIITTTGALDDGIVSLDDSFPVETSNSDIGREIANSHDSACGGTFAESFANSCNTVFAPLGAELGGERLVETAELYGFNETPAMFDPAAEAAVEPPPSTIPADISDSVEVGESAIGQGQVLATPLAMASVSQVVANEGVRMPTPIAREEELQPDMEPVEVTSPETAKILRELMVGVVQNGTGVAGGLPNVQVAGKTGTAELGPAALAPGTELAPGEEAVQELDAWFTAFAPANDPKLAVAVMVVNSEGDGGEVAAPIASQVLDAGLD